MKIQLLEKDQAAESASQVYDQLEKRWGARSASLRS